MAYDMNINYCQKYPIVKEPNLKSSEEKKLKEAYDNAMAYMLIS